MTVKDGVRTDIAMEKRSFRLWMEVNEPLVGKLLVETFIASRFKVDVTDVSVGSYNYLVKDKRFPLPEWLRRFVAWFDHYHVVNNAWPGVKQVLVWLDNVDAT